MQTDEKETESLGTRAEIEELGGCKRRMKAAVPARKVIEELDRNYQDLAKTVQIPGFRKGRVPRPLLESRFGEEIESEVKETMIAASFSQVIEEKELEVFSSPKFENVRFESDADLTYEVEFEVRPAFELPEYKGVEVAADKVEFSEQEVESELEKLRRQLATLRPARPEEIGEDGYLGGSYTLIMDGSEVKKVEKVTFQPSTDILEHFYIEDLSKRIKDRNGSPEASLVFDVKVPAHYPDEVLRGREARLELVVTEGFDLNLPDLDDEFAKKTNHESLDELRAEIRKTVQRRKEREVERRIEDAILDQLAARTEIDVPEALVESQVRRNRATQEQFLLEQGFSPERIEEYFAGQAAGEGAALSPSPSPSPSPAAAAGPQADLSGPEASPSGSEAGLSESESSPPEEGGSPPVGDGGETRRVESATTDEIRQTARKYFILEAIAEKEKIFVTEQNVEQKLAQMAPLYGMSPARLRAELEKTDRLNELRLSLKHDKVREFLRSKAKIAGGASEGERGTDVGQADAAPESVDEP